MWLLSTDRAELHFFPSPEEVTGGYAILSHTWGDNEQTFVETRDLAERCKEGHKNPRDFASEKVRKSCTLAAGHKYRWLWNDTCCIDKTSSADLSEAINSMFLWYSCAELCYVYLGDVESDCDLKAPGSAFRRARWHSRGWTLQELIAPSLVVFMSKDWTKILGTKVGLASLLQEITGIPSWVLKRRQHHSLISVAERMAWASKRDTTRVEDEAYCLMGLFNINMPTIYGEGRQAFIRLQQEIMKQMSDTSLFAWGSCLLDPERSTPITLQEMYQHSDTSLQNHVYLLALSPKSFVRDTEMVTWYTPSLETPLQSYWQPDVDASQSEAKVVDPGREAGPFSRGELPQFSISNYGLKCRLPIIESDGFLVAVLMCETQREHLGLLLHPSSPTNLVQDPSRRRYHVGYGFRTVSGQLRLVRLISLGNDIYNLRVRNGKAATVEWQDILITDSPPPVKRDAMPMIWSRLLSITPAPPFRLPPWLVGRLARLGMEITPLHVESEGGRGKPFQALASFYDVDAKEGIHLILGTCRQSPRGLPPHWAKATPWTPSLPQYHDVYWSHDCREDHVNTSQDRTKVFNEAPDRTIRLSFSPCPVDPKHTLVVRIELEGSIYDAMKDLKRVEFSSREETASPESNPNLDLSLIEPLVESAVHAALPSVTQGYANRTVRFVDDTLIPGSSFTTGHS